MRYAFAALMFVFAGLYAGVKQQGKFLSRLTFKTMASICFVMIAYLGRVGADRTYYALIVTGLCLALAGDVLLIFSDKKAKAAGGAAFLLAHIGYIAAFFVFARPAWYDAALFAAFVIIGAAIMGKRLSQAGKLMPLAILYGLALCTMTAKAISMLFVKDLNPIYAAFAALGGTLFALSDLLLAYAHFHEDKRGRASTLCVIIYYAAQGLIALSVAM